MSLVFEKGAILCYRIFDIAEEIDLERCRRLFAEARRLTLAREGSQYLQLPNPPLGIDLGKKRLGLKGAEVEAEATARIFDHGAASIILSVPIPERSTMEPLIVLADELYDSPAVERLAQELLHGVRQTIQPASEGPHLWEQNESYTVIFAERIEGDPNAAQLLEGGDLARLLLGESAVRSLSDRERSEVVQHRFSYTDRDLAVVDWNSAFVYEPTGSHDIPDILEISNAQLLEFRYYDDLLEGHIRNVHAEVKLKRRTWRAIFRSPYRLLARRVMAALLEMSEFVERVENSLKIIGDFYLAKVYEAAVVRLRIAAWQASVTRKQQMLTNVYQLLKGEVDTDRALTLEFTIAVLIITELAIALASVFKH